MRRAVATHFATQLLGTSGDGAKQERAAARCLRDKLRLEKSSKKPDGTGPLELQNRLHQFNSGRGLHQQQVDFSAQSLIPDPFCYRIATIRLAFQRGLEGRIRGEQNGQSCWRPTATIWLLA